MNLKRCLDARKARNASIFFILALSSLIAYAATQLHFDTLVNVSDSVATSEKGRLVRLAYVDNGIFVKPILVVYIDATGTAGGQFNVYARRSFDGGATWDGAALLSRDASGQPTGGQTIVVQGVAFLASNAKTSVFAPQFHANNANRSVLVSWISSYCPAPDGGALPNPVQRINTALVPNEPYKCVWTARSIDAGTTWTTEQLTDAGRDAANNVVAGSQGNNGFALAWQEDALGLQPGEAEGPGDGGSGAHTTGGTNIWYTHASNLNGANPLLRGNIVQLTDNTASPAPGDGPPLGPGASRPTLQMSGTTAAIVYEESKGDGSKGKGVHYHSFRFDAPDVNSDGLVVSDPGLNARRARVVLQGATQAGPSPLRVVILYRQGPATMPGAPADIIVQRGLKDESDAASTGYRPQDIEPQSAAVNVSDTGGSSPIDNARAHRAIIRGGSIAVGYTHTPDMIAAQPDSTTAPTQTYNFYVRISSDAGATWGPARNLSNILNIGIAAIAVGEPRLVPTPGTITNPLTGAADPGDAQNTDVFYAAWGLYANDSSQADYKVRVTRTTDFGASFELPAEAPGGPGQSEAQLRATPDGSSVAILWMQEMAPDGARDVMLATATPGYVPDPTTAIDSDNGGCLYTATRGRGGPVDPMLPAMALVAALSLALSRPFTPANRIPINAPPMAHERRDTHPGRPEVGRENETSNHFNQAGVVS